jgi:hypothetical protein
MNNRNAKFTDRQLEELWIIGLSEREIAKKLGVTRSPVTRRKQKLGLVANHEPHHGKKQTHEELKITYKKHAKNASDSANVRYTKEEKKERIRKYQKLPDVKARRKKYKEKHPEQQTMFGKKYHANWRKNNPDKTRAASKKYYDKKSSLNTRESNNG